MKRVELTNFICREILEVNSNIRNENDLRCAVKRGLKKAHRVEVERTRIKKSKKKGVI